MTLPAFHDGYEQDQWSEVTSKHQCQRKRLIDNFQQSVVAAVYVDQSLKSRRESSVMIAGLEPSVGTPDAKLFAPVCLAEFVIKLDIVHTKRLSHIQVGRTQPLLVYLKQASQSQQLTNVAKLL
jgi:hypothetical protein